MKSIQILKHLRDKTGLSISVIKKALEQANFDALRAEQLLQEKFKEIAGKKAERQTKQGIVASYIHPTQKIGAMVALLCETDFVARNQDFQNLAHELCLQIAAMEPKDIKELLVQPWIKDSAKTIQDVINEVLAKVGERIVIGQFVRYEI